MSKSRDTRGRAPEGGTQKMDPRKQATLMNYHKAIEENVDLDKLWPEVEEIFTKQEKMDINRHKGKEKMRRFVDVIASKDDSAFDGLVKGLRRDYRWLGRRLMQGVKEEDMRLKQAGDGVKQKIALALLTTRISERQKEDIIHNVSDVVDNEIHSKALKVSIPDHRASTELDHINLKLRRVINEEVDPLLYGPGHRTELSPQEADDVVSKLQSMLIELNVIQDCYSAMGVHAYSNSGKALPTILCQKIEETKTSIDLLQKEKRDLNKEKAELAKEKNLHGRDVGTLETRNRNLELHNRSLEAECGKLDIAVKKLSAVKESLEIEKRKLQDENSRLNVANQHYQTETWNLGIKQKKFEELNQKLVRENHKLTTKNLMMRRDLGPSSSTALRMENKTLMDTRAKLRTEMGKIEGEKRQLLIRNQKLEYENDNLRDQKRKLLVDKRKYFGENQQLKTEAKRLAIGNGPTGFLPPISEVRGSRNNLRSSSHDLGSGGRNSPTQGGLSKNSKANKRGRSTSPNQGYKGTRNNSPTRGNNPSSQKAKGGYPGSNLSKQGNSKSGIHTLQTSKYRASVYDYRPNDNPGANKSSSTRYGNKA